MNFREEIEAMKRRVSDDLPDVDAQHVNDTSTALITYRDTFAPHFIEWMSLTRDRCRSEVAKKACEDNLRCEIEENHPLLLGLFVKSVSVSDTRISHCLSLIHAITSECQSDAMEGLLILAALENASLVFIPWMEKAADKLNVPSEDREYLRRHGMADIAHAQEFIRALEAEVECHDAKALHGLALVEELLRNIFWGNT